MTYSANLVAEEEEEEVLTGKEIFFTVVLAIGLAVLMFIVIPTTLAHFLKAYAPSYLQNIIGFAAHGNFVGYVAGIGRMKDIQRVFQYHGAEQSD